MSSSSRSLDEPRPSIGDSWLESVGCKGVIDATGCRKCLIASDGFNRLSEAPAHRAGPVGAGHLIAEQALRGPVGVDARQVELHIAYRAGEAGVPVPVAGIEQVAQVVVADARGNGPGAPDRLQ